MPNCCYTETKCTCCNTEFRLYLCFCEEEGSMSQCNHCGSYEPDCAPCMSAKTVPFSYVKEHIDDAVMRIVGHSDHYIEFEI